MLISWLHTESEQEPKEHMDKLISYIVPSVDSILLCLFLELHNLSILACFSSRSATWARVSIWLAIGLLVYVFYGRTHSALKDAVYVPATQADDTYLA